MDIHSSNSAIKYKVCTQTETNIKQHDKNTLTTHATRLHSKYHIYIRVRFFKRKGKVKQFGLE